MQRFWCFLTFKVFKFVQLAEVKGNLIFTFLLNWQFFCSIHFLIWNFVLTSIIFKVFHFPTDAGNDCKQFLLNYTKIDCQFFCLFFLFTQTSLMQCQFPMDSGNSINWLLSNCTTSKTNGNLIFLSTCINGFQWNPTANFFRKRSQLIARELECKWTQSKDSAFIHLQCALVSNWKLQVVKK